MSAWKNAIIVVSGLPRSGTSMMMRMLGAGGIPLLSDAVRAPDADNPHGYFEFEPVKRLRNDAAWLAQARGKAVKVISFLLPELPPEHLYLVVFMHRALPEILASQRVMLEHQGKPVQDGTRTAALFEKHLRHMRTWLPRQAHMRTLAVEHRHTLAAPLATARALDRFLGGGLDTQAAAAQVDPALHRQVFSGTRQDTGEPRT